MFPSANSFDGEVEKLEAGRITLSVHGSFWIRLGIRGLLDQVRLRCCSQTTGVADPISRPPFPQERRNREAVTWSAFEIFKRIHG
jgi:hypothetical protein